MTVRGEAVGAPTATPALDLSPIQAPGDLIDHGLADLRRTALDVVAHGIRAADPAAAVAKLVRLDGSILRVGSWSADLDAVRSVVLLGAGKASLPIAAELERIIGDRLAGGLIVRRRGAPGSLDRVNLIEADHPVPSMDSLAAGERLLAAADSVHPDDLVITAFTGGSSALACVPAPGVPFEVKRELHRLLLDSGAKIAEINAVRKHVSALKGGRLAARMNGARILNLTMSDVVGDQIDLLCDPVVQDSSTVDDAITVLHRFGLWDQVAPEIRDHLGSSAAHSPLIAADLDVTTVVLASGQQIVEHMADRARALGYEPVIMGSTIEGEAATVGAMLGSIALESASSGRPFANRAVMVGAGGEATVTMTHANQPAGIGGPNQEVAIAFARSVARLPVCAAGAFVDSDGSDGGTHAAGGCVDSLTWARGLHAGLDLSAALAGHNASAGLAALGDLIVTGQTGTNISDIWAVAIDGSGPSTQGLAR